jgi:thiamine biosynthesis lipoprotein ApbE
MIGKPFLLASLCLALAALLDPAAAVTLERTRYLMGTSLTLTLEGDDVARLQEAATAVFEEVAGIESALSNWREDSEVNRLNRSPAGVEFRVSAHLASVLERGLYWADRTRGAFDPALESLVHAYDLRGEGRRPTAEELAAAQASSGWRHVEYDAARRTVRLTDGAGIETGGIGKGYALDRAASVLRSCGVRAALLDFGGHVLAIGAPSGEPGWQVRLADPRARERGIATVMLRDASLSTSEQSERSLPSPSGPIGHILDPRTAQPVVAWGSAAAVATAAIDADALSTALFVMGPEEAARWIERHEAGGQIAGLLLVKEQGDVRLRTAGVHPGLLATQEAGGEAQVGTDTAAAAEPAPSNAELARRIDILAEEIESARLGEAATPIESRYGLGPAASSVYRVEPRGVSVAGYGEVLYENFSTETESGSLSNAKDQVDALRVVTYFGYKFSDKILVNSEIEFEHASTGKRGEVSVEFAYLDFLLRPEVNARVGLLLVPMGFINEMHEPPTFLGTRRPDVEQRILPSTWRANGAGIFGELGGFSYRTYLVEGLRAKGTPFFEPVGGYSAANGVRDGRQSGSFARVENWAGTGRLDWRSRFGLSAAASTYYGHAGQGDTTPTGKRFKAWTLIWETHAEYKAHGVWMRALFARGHIDEATEINRANFYFGNQSVGTRFHGAYAEAGYDVWRLLRPESELNLYPFARYEWYDTQAETPLHYPRNPANERTVLTLGAQFYPHPQVALKADYQARGNEAETGVDQWNLAVSYLF